MTTGRDAVEHGGAASEPGETDFVTEVHDSTLDAGPTDAIPRGFLRSNAFHISAIALLAVGVGASVLSFILGVGSFALPGAGLWPMIVSVSLALLGFALVFSDRRADYEPWSRGIPRVVVPGFLLIVGYILLAPLFGLVLPGVAMLAIWLILLSREKWWLALIVAVATPTLLYAIFDLGFGIPFPVGTVFEPMVA